MRCRLLLASLSVIDRVFVTTHLLEDVPSAAWQLFRRNVRRFVAFRLQDSVWQPG